MLFIFQVYIGLGAFCCKILPRQRIPVRIENAKSIYTVVLCYLDVINLTWIAHIAPASDNASHLEKGLCVTARWIRIIRIRVWARYWVFVFNYRLPIIYYR